MRGVLFLLAIGGGALIFTGRQIPFTMYDYSTFPGGPKVVGALLVMFGLFLAAGRED
jgi:hypothetical protein